MEQGIIWFRNDLRIKQNAALDAALKSGLPLKAVYVLDERTERLGHYRRSFLQESLDELTVNLEQFSISLEIVEGNPGEQIHKIIAHNELTTLFANKGYAHEELKQEQELESFAQVNLRLFDDGFLIPPHNLPFAISVPERFVYPWEKTQIVLAHIRFASWAQSGGSSYSDWYKNLSGYRDDTKLYVKP
jgi:deoxyribodipyrimidine photo-lyase